MTNPRDLIVYKPQRSDGEEFLCTVEGQYLPRSRY